MPPKREAKTNKKGGDAHDHESSLPSKGISYEIKIDELEVGSSMEGATKTTTAAANTAEEESGDVDEKIHVNEDLGVVDDMLPKSKAGSKITETVVEADSVVKVASIDANNLSTVTAVDPFSEINESVESFLKSEVDISTDDETTLMMETARKTLEDALKTFEKAIAQRGKEGREVERETGMEWRLKLLVQRYETCQVCGKIAKTD